MDPGRPGRAAHAEGIAVSRSQVRRILQAEGVRWRTVRSWSRSGDPGFAPKGSDHRPLHHPTAADHRDLRRRARPGDPPQLSAPVGLVAGRLADHPRIRQVFIPKGACWLNLQEGWWRIFRRAALAGQTFTSPREITLATEVATCQLNARARPWVWGRPRPSPRYRRRVFTYRIKGTQH